MARYKTVQVLDVHGYTVAEVCRIFDETINDARLNNTTREIRFITGNGPLRNHLIELAEEHQMYYYDYDLGSVFIIFE